MQWMEGGRGGEGGPYGPHETAHLSLEPDNFRAELGELGADLVGGRHHVGGSERRHAFGALAKLEGGQGLLRLLFLRAAADDQHRAGGASTLYRGRRGGST